MSLVYRCDAEDCGSWTRDELAGWATICGETDEHYCSRRCLLSIGPKVNTTAGPVKNPDGSWRCGKCNVPVDLPAHLVVCPHGVEDRRAREDGGERR